MKDKKKKLKKEKTNESELRERNANFGKAFLSILMVVFYVGLFFLSNYMDSQEEVNLDKINEIEVKEKYTNNQKKEKNIKTECICSENCLGNPINISNILKTHLDNNTSRKEYFNYDFYLKNLQTKDYNLLDEKQKGCCILL